MPASLSAMTQFYVFEPRFWTLDTYYKVYVTDEALHFAAIGGQFHRREATRAQLWPIYLTGIGAVVVELLAHWKECQCRASEERADAAWEAHGSIRELDKRNFVLRHDEIEHITAVRCGHWWTCWLNEGVLAIEAGAQRRLMILWDKAGFDLVTGILQNGNFPVEVPAYVHWRGVGSPGWPVAV